MFSLMQYVREELILDEPNYQAEGGQWTQKKPTRDNICTRYLTYSKKASKQMFVPYIGLLIS